MTPVRDPSRQLNLFHRHNLPNTKQILEGNTANTGLCLNSIYTGKIWQFQITNTEHYHSYTAHRLLRGCNSIATTHEVNLHVYATQTAHFRVPAEHFSNCNTHNRSHDVWETKQTIHLIFFLLSTWLYPMRGAVLSARPLLACAPLCVSRDERDPSNRSPSPRVSFNSYLNISSNSRNAPMPSGCASFRLVPYHFFGTMQAEEYRTPQNFWLVSGSNITQPRPSTDHLPLSPALVYSSGTSSTTAQWHLYLLAHAISLS
jgi:hypothetical protein